MILKHSTMEPKPTQEEIPEVPVKDNGETSKQPVQLEPARPSETQTKSGLSDDMEARLEAFRQVCEHYRQDIRMFWTGSSFYIVVHGGLLSVFAVGSDGFIRIMLASFGVYAGIYWWRAANGIIFFMQKWRNLMIECNDLLQPSGGWYSKGARMVNENSALIPANVTKTMARYVTVLWCIALVYALDSITGKHIAIGMHRCIACLID